MNKARSTTALRARPSLSWVVGGTPARGVASLQFNAFQRGSRRPNHIASPPIRAPVTAATSKERMGSSRT
jgi:hypothetical protein